MGQSIIGGAEKVGVLNKTQRVVVTNVLPQRAAAPRSELIAACSQPIKLLTTVADLCNLWYVIPDGREA